MLDDLFRSWAAEIHLASIYRLADERIAGLNGHLETCVDYLTASSLKPVGNGQLQIR